MGWDSTNWRINFCEKLAVARQINSFNSIFENYLHLLQLYSRQESMLSQYKEKISDMNQNRTVADGSPGSNEKIDALEKKIFSLQEELTKQFRTRSEAATQIMDMTNERKKLTKQIESLTLDKDTVSGTLKIKETDLKEKTDLLEKQKNTIEYLRNETVALRTEIQKLNENLELAKNDSKQLLNRFLEQKEQQIEAMNQATELHNALMKQKEEFDKLTQKYKTKSESADNTIGSQSGGMVGFSSQQMAKKAMMADPGIELNAPKDLFSKTNTNSPINFVAFSADGNFLATAHSDKRVCIWNSNSATASSKGAFALTQTLSGSADSVMCVAFSPNGKLVCGSSADKTSKIWNTANGRVCATLSGHDNKIHACDFSSDSTKVVTGGLDRTLKIFDASRGDCIKTIISTCQSSVNAIDIDQTNDVICSAHFDSTVRFHDIKSHQLVQIIQKAHNASSITSVKISASNQYLATLGLDNIVKIWDYKYLSQPVMIFTHELFQTTSKVNQVCFSPALEYVVAGGNNGNLFIWSMKDQKQPCTVLKKAHTDAVTGVTWSSDGAFLVSGSLDKQYCVWT